MGLTSGGLQTGGLQNLSGIGDIPDSGLQHHYDWSATSSADTITDQAGLDDLSATGSPTLNGSINATQAGRLDGTDDFYDTLFSATVSRAFQVFFVATLRSQDTNNDQYIIDGGTSAEHLVYENASGEWRLNYGGNGTNGGDSDTNPHVFETNAVTGGNDELLLDGATEISTSVGSDDLTGLHIGILGDESGGESPLDIGEIAVYNTSASGYSASDVRQYLADKWGISLA
jgi:hypothetical protein